MPDESLTAEEIQAHYDAALDSVTLITDLMALDSRDDDQTATVARNVEHLQIMVAKQTDCFCAGGCLSSLG
jgi:hypothetical protein